MAGVVHLANKLFYTLHDGGSQVFTAVEHFALLLSAVVHDLGHGGVSNDYLIQTSSNLLGVHGKESLWEKHHLCRTLSLLQDPRYQFFEVRVHTQLVSDVALPQHYSSHATPRLLGTIGHHRSPWLSAAIDTGIFWCCKLHTSLQRHIGYQTAALTQAFTTQECLPFHQDTMFRMCRALVLQTDMAKHKDFMNTAEVCRCIVQG